MIWSGVTTACALYPCIQPWRVFMMPLSGAVGFAYRVRVHAWVGRFRLAAPLSLTTRFLLVLSRRDLLLLSSDRRSGAGLQFSLARLQPC
jgi:hypothetical protein